jgi:fumarate reductase subunit C
MSPYQRAMAPTWWLSNRAYFLFIVRELTSVFIAAYLVLFLLMLRKLAVGREAYEAYLRFLSTPGMFAFHVLALAAALYHTVTWFNLSPMAMRVRFGEKRVPPAVVVGVNYVAWIVLSLALTAIVLWR